MLRWFRGDLHIHTVLSPCAELNMGPHDIVQQALEKGLDFIAITDHNSTLNVAAVMAVARNTNLTVFPGVEVATREDIHMICLFPEMSAMAEFQCFLNDNLTNGENDISMWGPQIIVDEFENIIGEEKLLLSLPIQQGYMKIIEKVLAVGGIIYPAHIDRKANSMVRTLGFLPNNLPFNVIELSKRSNPEEAVERYQYNNNLQLITASDAHDLSQIGCVKTYFKLQAPIFSELYLAFKNIQGRMLSLLDPEKHS
jgi:PHP family Zn ribbon phosphoesterase